MSEQEMVSHICMYAMLSKTPKLSLSSKILQKFFFSPHQALHYIQKEYIKAVASPVTIFVAGVIAKDILHL